MNILVTGANGQVGRELQRYGRHILAYDRDQLDITETQAVYTCIAEQQPELVINAAAYTAVDKAEQEPELAYAINRDGAANLAQACAEYDLPLIHISTDYVFDGQKQGAYLETDPIAPQSVYGDSKWQGEEQVRQYCPKHIILRTSWVFGQYGHNFVRTIVRLAKEREQLSIVADQHGCPTHAGAIARTLFAIAANPAFRNGSVYGTYHYCGQPALSWYEFAIAIVREMRPLTAITAEKIVPISTAEFPTAATRPANSVLDCRYLQAAFGIKPQPWQQGLREVLQQWL